MPLSLPVLTLLTVLSGCSAGPSQTPLHTAAAEGDLVMIKQLLADGAGVDAVDESGLKEASGSEAVPVKAGETEDGEDASDTKELSTGGNGKNYKDPLGLPRIL